MILFRCGVSTQICWSGLAGMHYDVLKGFSLLVGGDGVVGPYAV